MESFLSPWRMHGDDGLRSGTAFGVLVFSRHRRRSPLSLRPPATVCQPFGLKNSVHGELSFAVAHAWGRWPAVCHRLRGAGVFAAPPEVSAVAATSGYCLSTLRVEEQRSWRAFFRRGACMGTMACGLPPPSGCWCFRGTAGGLRCRCDLRLLSVNPSG